MAVCMRDDIRFLVDKGAIEAILKDRTTGENIIWATDAYATKGATYAADAQMTVEQVLGDDSVIKTRVEKAAAEQLKRTRSHAEVFTPSWICNQMNNYCDESWFGRKDVFNVQTDTTWETVKEKIAFPEGKTWKKYVDSRRLEITCGEAPYLVSRYNAATGETIAVPDRVGILDRKLRVVNENTETREEWFKWVLRAFQSAYGYEWQGDSLLVARVNLAMTFVEYVRYRWGEDPSEKELRTIINTIVWNIWQMDGLKSTVPYGVRKEDPDEQQMTFFDMGWDDAFPSVNAPETPPVKKKCKIYDWRANRSMLFADVAR